MLVLILAAGKGTRMKSSAQKVLVPVAGLPMLDYTIQLAEEMNPSKIVVVAGSGYEAVEKAFSGRNLVFLLQKEQLGTADAVLTARENIEAETGKVLILNGDMPCVTPDTLKSFIKECSGDKIAFISVEMREPFGYGRVVRSVDRQVLRITEEKDANAAEKKIREINTGLYYCDAATLLERLGAVGNNNAQKEYYLTDIITAGSRSWKAKNEAEFQGVNDRAQLAGAAKLIWRRRADKHMAGGVSIVDPDNVYISAGAEIQPDVTLYPGVYIEGACKISSGTEIRHGVRLVSSLVGSGCEIRENTLIEESFIGDDCTVGPMAHLRPGTRLEGANQIGNYVELKKAVLGRGSKASHLTYLGDCTLGSVVNVGCGTITCNYDGFRKYETHIGSNVFVGSDVQFIAPVTIGDGALIAAGSTITRDVEPDSLAIARSPQINIAGKAAAIRLEKKGK